MDEIKTTHQVSEQTGIASIHPQKKNRKYLIVIVGFIIVLGALFSFFSIRYLNGKNESSRKEEKKQTETVDLGLLLVDNTVIKGALVPYIPHFDALEISDLPRFSDNRGIYQYNNSLLFVNYDFISQLDEKSNSFVRVSNNAVLDCAFSSAKIGNYLYVDCTGNEELGDSKVRRRGIYKIDLRSGDIVKSYFDKARETFSYMDESSPELDKTPGLVNARLTSHENDLWIGVHSGILKINTENDTVTYFNRSDLGVKDSCRGFNPFSNYKAIWHNSCGISVYSFQTNKWKSYSNTDLAEVNCSNSDDIETVGYSQSSVYFRCFLANDSSGNSRMNLVILDIDSGILTEVDPKLEYEQYDEYLAKNFKDVVITTRGSTWYFDETSKKPVEFLNVFPEVFGVSNKQNEKYYLATKNGIYKLARNSFPKLLTKLTESGEYLTDSSKFYVTKDEKYFLLFGPPGGIGSVTPTIGEESNAQLVDIQTGQITDLIQNSGLTDVPADGDFGQIIRLLKSLTIKEEGDKLNFYQQDLKLPVMFVDLSSKQIKFIKEL